MIKIDDTVSQEESDRIKNIVKEQLKGGEWKRFIFDDDLITVCAGCFCASCWQGEFYCEDYKDEGTTQKTRSELISLKLENSSYLKTDEVLSNL